MPGLLPVMQIYLWGIGSSNIFGPTTHLGGTQYCIHGKSMISLFGTVPMTNWKDSLHIVQGIFGITFTYVVDEKSLVFLDLELRVDDKVIHSRTHFKLDAGNSHLHARNHHPRWIKNIPFGQFCRLRRTCTLKNDHEEQSLILKSKFKEKGVRR